MRHNPGGRPASRPHSRYLGILPSHGRPWIHYTGPHKSSHRAGTSRTDTGYATQVSTCNSGITPVPTSPDESVTLSSHEEHEPVRDQGLELGGIDTPGTVSKAVAHRRQSFGKAPSSHPIQIAAPSLNASQSIVGLQNGFSWVFFPRGDETVGSTIFQPSGVDTDPTLSASNSLCLLMMGYNREDPFLVRSAFALYGRSLYRLQRHLERVRLNAPLDSIISAVTMMAALEMICVNSSFNAPGWVLHAQGIFEFLRICEQRAPESALTWSAPFTHAIYVFAIDLGLVTRRAVKWTPPDWFKEFIRQLSPIFDVASSVPSYLEALDGLGQQYPPDSVAIRQTISESQRLVDNLRAKQEAELFSENSRPLRTIHDVDEFDTFVAAMGHLASMFPTAFSFPHLNVARAPRLAWISILLLSQAILDVCTAHGNEVDILDDREMARIRWKRN